VTSYVTHIIVVEKGVDFLRIWFIIKLKMREYISNKKSLLLIPTFLLFFSLFYFFFFKSTEAQVCLPLTGYIVWPGTWQAGIIPMASTSQYYLAPSPISVSGSNVGIGYTSPAYKLQVDGDISGTRLCIGSDCRDQWPRGTLSGTGSAGQVTFWTGPGDLGGDNNLFWNNTNKRLGIGTTTPQTSLHVIGNVTANTFLGTINAANVSSGQFGANTGGGNYSFPGNVGIGTTAPGQKLTIAGGNISFDTGGLIDAQTAIGAGANDLGITAPDYVWIKGGYATILGGTNVGPSPAVWISQSTGNVGIGTTAPQSKLHIVGASGVGRSVMIHDREIKFRGDGVAHFSIYGPDTGKSYLTIQNTSANAAPGTVGTDLLTITSGNVGIGTTAPSPFKLRVVGPAGSSATALFENPGSDSWVWVSSDAGKSRGFIIATNVNARWILRADVGVETGGNVGSDFAITRVSDTGIWLDHPIYIKRDTGNVGIGTTAPSLKSFM
jgi:hypothetical protein